MKCIICNNDKEPSEFSKEHVIPESAGSSYFIDTVCKDCNNLLGRTIDNKFLDNFFVKLYLSKFNIKIKKENFRNYGLPCLQEKILKLKEFLNTIHLIINLMVGNIIMP